MGKKYFRTISLNIIKLLFSFDGNIGRRLFWIITLIILGLNAEIGHIFSHFNENNPMTISLGSISILWFILVVWIMLAIQVKRCHDIGKSGWWVTINLIPIFGTIWMIIQCGFIKGKQTK